MRGAKAQRHVKRDRRGGGAGMVSALQPITQLAN